MNCLKTATIQWKQQQIYNQDTNNYFLKPILTHETSCETSEQNWTRAGEL